MPTDQTLGTPLSNLQVPPLVPSLPLPSRFCITNTPRADNDRPTQRRFVGLEAHEDVIVALPTS
jgi:hypothetical protein